MFSSSIRTTVVVSALFASAALTGCAAPAASSEEGPSASAAEALTFTVRLGDALIQGTGCSEATTYVTHDEGKINIEFNDLAVSLNPFEAAYAGRKSCVVRIPVTIPAGYYVSRVIQRAEYGAETTTGARAAIASSASLLGATVGGLSKKIGGDASEYDSLFRSSAFKGEGDCSDAPKEGFLAVNLALTASRDEAYDTAQVAVYNYTLDASQDIVLSRCWR